MPTRGPGCVTSGYERVVRIVLLVAVELASVAACHRLGHIGWLQVAWGDPGTWLAVTPPGDALAALILLAATILSWWVLVTTLAHLASRVVAAPAAVRATTRLLVPGVRRALAGTLVGATLTGPAHAVVGPPVPPHAVAPSEEPTASTARSGHLGPTEVSYVVAPGDSLWSIAAAHAPDDTAPYWLRLVAANRSRLRSGDPDLLHPGERLRLPDRRPH